MRHVRVSDHGNASVRRRNAMKITNLLIVGIFVIALAGTLIISGCCNKADTENYPVDGPAEKAGAALDKTLKDASEKAKGATNKAIDKTGEVLEKVGNKLEETGADLQNKDDE